MLSNSKKPLLILERPYEKGTQTRKTSLALLSKMRTTFRAGRCEEALDAAGQYVAIQVRNIIAREEYILDGYESRICEKIRSIPHLREKSSVSVFQSIGAGHTALLHELKRRLSKQLTAEWFRMPLIYSPLEEAQRRLRFLGERPNRSALIRIVLSRLALEYYASRNISDAILDQKVRALSMRISEQQFLEMGAFAGSHTNCPVDQLFHSVGVDL